MVSGQYQRTDLGYLLALEDFSGSKWTDWPGLDRSTRPCVCCYTVHNRLCPNKFCRLAVSVVVLARSRIITRWRVARAGPVCEADRRSFVALPAAAAPMAADRERAGYTYSSFGFYYPALRHNHVFELFHSHPRRTQHADLCV